MVVQEESADRTEVLALEWEKKKQEAASLHQRRNPSPQRSPTSSSSSQTCEESEREARRPVGEVEVRRVVVKVKKRKSPALE